MPSQQQLDSLERAILAIGGRGLPEPCVSTELPAMAPGEKVQEDASAAREAVSTAYTQGCGALGRFTVPYDEDPDAPYHGTLVVCAICDAATRFPRLQEEY